MLKNNGYFSYNIFGTIAIEMQLSCANILFPRYNDSPQFLSSKFSYNHLWYLESYFYFNIGKIIYPR